MKLFQVLILYVCVTSQLMAQSNKTGEIKDSVKDWAKFYRYEDENKLLTDTPYVVFMGNSITEGWVKIHADFFKNNGFIGRGISGQTSSEMLVRFQSDVIQLHPKKVVINAGTNDIAQNNGKINLEHILQNIKSMSELAFMNKIEPVLTSVLPCDQFWWNTTLKPAQEIIKLNELIRTFAFNHNLVFIDYYKSMVNEVDGMDSKYSDDGVHPNSDGYNLMEKIAIKYLK